MAPAKKRKAEDEAPAAPVAVESIEVKKADVPEYLHRGLFYEALADDDEETFVVPGDAMKPDASIKDADDLIYLLKSLRFWGVEGNVQEIIDFVMQNAEAPAIKSSLAAFEADYPYLFTLRRILRNPIPKRLEIALETGDVEMVKYLTNKNVGPTFELTPHSTEVAAKHGNLNLLQYLHETGVAWSPHVFCAVIHSGSLECAHNLHKHCDFSAQKMDNFYPTLITDHNIDVYIYGLLNGIGDSDSMVQFLTSNTTSMVTVMTSSLKRLKYFHAQKVPFPAGLAAHCAQNGYMDQLKFLHSQGVAFDLNACHRAAEFNQLKALKFLHENGAPWDAFTSACAAVAGSLPCLKYCHTNGCAWDMATTSAAVRGNSVACLKYAHEQGCPWNDNAWWKYLNKECEEYLVKHNCPKPNQVV